MCKSNLANVEMPKCAFGGMHCIGGSCPAMQRTNVLRDIWRAKVTTGEAGIDTIFQYLMQKFSRSEETFCFSFACRGSSDAKDAVLFLEHTAL